MRCHPADTRDRPPTAVCNPAEATGVPNRCKARPLMIHREMHPVTRKGEVGMADATNPRNSDAVNQASSHPVKDYSQPVPGRLPLVAFAASMAFLLAGFQAIWAIVECFNVVWIAGTASGTFYGYLWLWAILDLLIAALFVYAGIQILSGGPFGHVYGVIIAGLSALRWFFYLPAAPVLGIVIIAIDLFI